MSELERLAQALIAELDKAYEQDRDFMSSFDDAELNARLHDDLEYLIRYIKEKEPHQ